MKVQQLVDLLTEGLSEEVMNFDILVDDVVYYERNHGQGISLVKEGKEEIQIFIPVRGRIKVLEWDEEADGFIPILAIEEN